MSPFFLQTHQPRPLDARRYYLNADNALAFPAALSDRPAALNEWTHLAGVYDPGARQFRLDVNGKLTGTAEGGPKRCSTAPVPSTSA